MSGYIRKCTLYSIDKSSTKAVKGAIKPCVSTKYCKCVGARAFRPYQAKKAACFSS